MTTPVTQDDIVQGACKWLATFDDILELVGVFDDDAPYIFQYQLGVVLEGTQTAAIVVNRIGSWSPPNISNTMKFPRLSIEIYVDPIRDDDGNYIEPAETQRRASLLSDTIDKHLHRPQGGTQLWGDVRTLDCTRLGELIAYPTPDGDGMIRGQCFYGLSQG